MQRYSIYFWEPEISPHKLPLFYEIHDHPRVEGACFIAQRQLNDERRRQGWETELHFGSDVLVSPDKDNIETIVSSSSPKNAVHIFSGMHWVPCIVDGLKAVIRNRRRFGILHEPRVLEGLKGVARLAHSWATESSLRRHANFVLAIGSHGPQWFRLTGYRNERIFPFAYFLRGAAGRSSELDAEGEHVPVVAFLGRLEKLKGIHLFLESLPRIRNHIQVRVAGHGSQEALVRSALAEHSASEFLGAIRMSDVERFLRGADILVLPSITKDDGWGAVVSEALMAGTAVVASDRVGASMCLNDVERGLVVRDLTGAAIAKAVDMLIDGGYTEDHYREARSAWAVRHLDQVAGAQYLIEILDHLFAGKPRPSAFIPR